MSSCGNIEIEYCDYIRNTLDNSHLIITNYHYIINLPVCKVLP